jgi:TP901-1 family phage major tail protein
MAKVKGDDVYVKINTGTVGSPVWTKMGSQKDCSWAGSLDTIDVTDKDSAGWKESLAGNRGFEPEFEAFLVEDDSAFAVLKAGYFSRNAVGLQIITPTKTYQGTFYVTELSMEGPLGDASTVSFSLVATGAVTES